MTVDISKINTLDAHDHRRAQARRQTMADWGTGQITDETMDAHQAHVEREREALEKTWRAAMASRDSADATLAFSRLRATFETRQAALSRVEGLVRRGDLDQARVILGDVQRWPIRSAPESAMAMWETHLNFMLGDVECCELMRRVGWLEHWRCVCLTRAGRAPTQRVAEEWRDEAWRVSVTLEVERDALELKVNRWRAQWRGEVV